MEKEKSRKRDLDLENESKTEWDVMIEDVIDEVKRKPFKSLSTVLLWALVMFSIMGSIYFVQESTQFCHKFKGDSSSMMPILNHVSQDSLLTYEEIPTEFSKKELRKMIKGRYLDGNTGINCSYDFTRWSEQFS